MTTLAPTAAHARGRLVERASHAESVPELFRVAAGRLGGLVPFDASIWLATDPAMGLPTAPTYSDGLRHICTGDPQACLRVWELEFSVADVNLFRDVGRDRTPAAALREATGDRPARSPRYTEILSGAGFGDELRAVLRVDGRPWAWVALLREHGRPAFTPAETALVAGLSTPLGAAVRAHARPVAPALADAGRGPGVVVVAPTGELVSMTEEARAWMEELAPPVRDPGVESALPMAVVATLARSRAIARERDAGTARARIRSPLTGRWLLLHASCMRDRDGALGDLALVIEPAAGEDIAPVVAEALELSPRERQVTELVARGEGTAAIAHHLHLSPHTVREHLKAAFEKAGVSSRGELVATIFAGFHARAHLAPGAHEAAGS